MPDDAALHAGALRIITERPKFGTGLGLQRMQAVMTGMPRALWCAGGRPIHVTGSQGKGTVTTLAAALLDQLGYKTGRFISPHLMRFEERIAIGGVPVDAGAFATAAQSFADREEAYLNLHPGDRFGSFEALTATAFHAFTAADVDVAVLEAGIGGRYDSTRAAGGELVALTGIDQEHSALLGPTEEHILYDKADLCPARGLLVAGRLPEELKRRLGAYGAIRGFDILYADEQVTFSDLHHEATGAVGNLSVDGLALHGLKTRVFGAAQFFNVALAFLLVRAWIERKGRRIDERTLLQAAHAAFARTELPLRFERLGTDPLVIADVAHTRSATRALAATIHDVLAPARGVVLLVGIAEDKPAPAVLEPLIPLASAIVCTQAYRGLPADLLAGLPLQKSGRPCLAIADPHEAYAEVCRLARAMDVPVIVTGSVFLAAAAKSIAAGNDPAALEFL